MSSLIINFKQVFSFLVWNIYFTFFFSVVDCTFYKSNIKSNYVIVMSLRVRSSRQEVFCKKKALAQLLSCKFCEIIRTTFLTEHLRWLLLAFQSESTLYSFRTSCSKQYLKFKWIVTSWKNSRPNIVQTSSLCNFQTSKNLQWKCA